MQLAPWFAPQFLDANGVPLANGTVATFEAGSTTVEKATYSSFNGSPNDNPITLDSAGMCHIWLDGLYFIRVYDADKNIIWEEDYVGGNSSGMIFTVDTIADLKALDHDQYSAAWVLGYHVKNDGGGGLFYYQANDTSTADNGYKIQPDDNAGRWHRFLNASSSINVKHFGAYGDNTNDDAQAFGDANTYASTNSLCIFVPAASYSIATNPSLTVPIILEPGALLTLSGNYDPTINTIISDNDLTQHFAGALNPTFAEGAITKPQWFGATGNGTDDDTAAFLNAIASIVTNGGKLVVPEAPDFYLVALYEIPLVSNVSIIGEGPRSILKFGANQAIDGMIGHNISVSCLTNVNIEGLTLDGNTANQGTALAGVGIVLNGIDCSISKCTFKNFYKAGILLGGENGSPLNMIASNNYFYNCQEEAIKLTYGNEIKIIQNYIDKIGTYGINIAGTAVSEVVGTIKNLLVDDNFLTCDGGSLTTSAINLINVNVGSVKNNTAISIQTTSDFGILEAASCSEIMYGINSFKGFNTPIGSSEIVNLSPSLNASVDASLEVKGSLTSDGDINVLGNIIPSKRILGKQGNSVTIVHSDGVYRATLGDGNFFKIINSPAFNLELIDKTGWTAGSVVYLIFELSSIISHNKTDSGNYVGILCSDAGDYTANPNIAVRLVFNGSKWLADVSQ